MKTKATATADQSADEAQWAARVYEADKIYGNGDSAIHALDGVNCGFRAGSFTAVMGPSGSGKSTLVHCAAGLEALSGGRVFIGGTEITKMGAKELTMLRREHIGFVFQSFNLVPSLTAEHNITLPLRLAGRSADPELFDAVVDAVGLRDRLTHRPAQLSGGQQQRVAVARAIVSDPALIIGDEPTGNLDSKAGAEVLGFLRAAVDQRSKSVVIVTHDPIAASYADSVVFLKDGRVVDWLEQPTASSVIDRMKRLGD
jgi:putative ABC transport system ATP-binding protein